MTRRDPPPERVSAVDVLRTLTGLVSLGAGLVVLVRIVPMGVNPVALVTGLAFLGFGVYRLSVVARRYRAYRLTSRQRYGRRER